MCFKGCHLGCHAMLSFPVHTHAGLVYHVIQSTRKEPRECLHGWRETFVRVLTGYTGRKTQPMIRTSFLR